MASLAAEVLHSAGLLYRLSRHNMQIDKVGSMLSSYSVLGLDTDRLSGLLERIGDGVEIITTPSTTDRTSSIEGYQLYAQGEDACFVYFVVKGAIVLHDPGQEFPDKDSVRVSLDSVVEMGDAVSIADLAKTQFFGIYRVGDHVGESEFVFGWKWLASGFVCHSTTVLRVEHSLFAQMLRDSEPIRRGLECDGALRRVAKEFDSTLATREKNIEFSNRLKREWAEKLRIRYQDAFDEGQEETEKWIDKYIHFENGEATPLKTYFRLHREYRACRLFRSHMFSVLTRKEMNLSRHEEARSFHHFSQLGFYLSCNTQGKKTTDFLEDAKIIAPRVMPAQTGATGLSAESSRSGSNNAGNWYTFDVKEIERVISFYQTVMLSEMHARVEDQLWERRVKGASVWQKPI